MPCAQGEHRQRNGHRPVQPELLRYGPMPGLLARSIGEVEEAHAENGLFDFRQQQTSGRVLTRRLTLTNVPGRKIIPKILMPFVTLLSR